MFLRVAVFCTIAICASSIPASARSFSFDSLHSQELLERADEEQAAIGAIGWGTKTVPEIIRLAGYVCEEHVVQTEDGFLLNVQRMHKSPGGPVVFLQHGILDSSFTWIYLGEKGLAFRLAEMGYDVWLGNSRGVLPLQHVTYKSGDKELFDWSVDEMMKYDLPAVLNYVLNETKADSLGYVGHSQGTAIAFGGLPQFPELSKKINLFVALAPVAFVGNVPANITEILGDKITRFCSWAPATCGKNLFAGLRFVLPMASRLATGSILRAFDELAGCTDPTCNLDTKEFPYLFTYYPSDTAYKNAMQYKQMQVSGRFRRYDYGEDENAKRYNQTTPPDYDLSKFAVPVAIFRGKFDKLSDPLDQEILVKAVKKHIVHDSNGPYGHSDFVWAPSSTSDIYTEVLTVLAKHSKKSTH